MSIASITASVDIANIALQRLGEPVITTMTEVSRNAGICNQLYAQNRDYCFNLAEWACLMQRAVLARSAKVSISGISKASPAVVAATGHTFVANELVTIEDVVGMTQVNEGTYRVFSVGTNSMTLYDTDGTTLDSTGFTAWISGGSVYRAPGAEYAFVYDLPADCLKVVEVLDSNFGSSDHYTFRKERNYIYTDLVNAGVKYVRQITDASVYESDLVEVMAARLAWLIVMRISGDKALKAEVTQDANAAVVKAKMTNAMGREDEGPPEASWLDSQR
jgi:hypothetical protein